MNFRERVRDGYDATAAEFAALFDRHLDDKPIERAMLTAFAELESEGLSAYSTTVREPNDDGVNSTPQAFLIARKRPVRDFCKQHGIAFEAWWPLARGKILDDPVITRIAAATGKSAAQVVLRWHLRRYDVFPKSVSPQRIAENFAVFDLNG